MSITQEQVKTEWEKADKDKSNTLSFKEITSLLHKLNLKLKEKEVKKKFKEVDTNGDGDLDFEEFNNFLERLRVRPEIAQIFNKYADEKKHTLSDEQLVKFLQTVQKESNADVTFAKKIISEFEKKIHEKDPEPTTLSLTGFASYLANSKYNSIFNPKNATVYQDMTQPFAHYWIASSHNTYLLGDQLKGESSVDAYINAFKKGCRCVELDCWDGSDKANPIIYHGHTLTSKITFREVVECVRDHGFVSTSYPVILSLEVHCGIEGQQAMAAILKEVLGGAGLLPDQCDQTGILPPPESLKNKVLLKGKMAAFTDAEEEADEQNETPITSSSSSSKKEKAKKEKSSEKKPTIEEKPKEETPTEEKKSKKEKGDKKKDEKKHQTTASELSELIHLKAVKFPGFKVYKDKNKAWEMSSFSEGKVTGFLQKSALEYVEYNSRQISRIFPKGMRIDSSNYDPVPSWNCGAQIVALNYQTGSESTWTNDGKFQDNGGIGYILKPQFMRESTITFNPEIKPKSSKTLELTIISGWQLPKVVEKENQKPGQGEVIDPYIKVSINGIASDRKSVKTKVVKNNGFNPVWDASFKIPISNQDLATVTFVVSDADLVSADDFVAQYSLPLYCIRDGYRYVPLKDKHGKLIDNSSLLIFTKFV